MKKCTFILIATVTAMNIWANKAASSDTTILIKDKIIEVTGEGDTFQAEVFTVTAEGDRKTPTQSSITYNGSSYNLLFFWKKKPQLDPHWNGIGIGMANFDGLDGVGGDLVMSKSYTIALNLIDYSIPINHHWLAVSGLGIDWTRYHFKGNRGLEEVDGVTRFVSSPEGVDYKSSKLLVYYLTLPILLEYQLKLADRNDFFVSGGLVGYIKCYSKSQVEYNIDGERKKINKGRDLNILPVNARAMLQVGIGDVSIYGYYSLFSMFEKDKGPDIKPIGLGVVLNF